jgi:hypothetical protein
MANYTELEIIKGLMNGDDMMKEFFTKESDKYHKELGNYNQLRLMGCPVNVINWNPPVKPDCLERYEIASKKYWDYATKLKELEHRIQKSGGRGMRNISERVSATKEKEKLKLEFEEMLFFMGN